MKEPAEKKPETIEVVGEAQAKETVNRRRMFGAGLLGVASMLAAACSGTDFASGSALGKKKKKKDESGGEDAADGPDADDGPDAGGPDGGALDVNDGDDPGNIQDETGLDDCAANATTSIDPNGDDIGDLKPKVKFYGRITSALVAIKFPVSDDINQVIIAAPDGKLIAVHTITGADKDGAGKYRPIVMDNLSLKVKGKELTEIRIILQTPNGKKAHTEKIEWFSTFDGRQVVDLGARDLTGKEVVPPEMPGKQSVTQFDAGIGDFDTDTSVTYPNDFNAGKVRNLRTANNGTTWSRGGGVMGTVTDIMGDPITIDGKLEDRQGILEYQVFCTYVNSGTDKVVRTILHIG